MLQVLIVVILNMVQESFANTTSEGNFGGGGYSPGADDGVYSEEDGGNQAEESEEEVGNQDEAAFQTEAAFQYEAAFDGLQQEDEAKPHFADIEDDVSS